MKILITGATGLVGSYIARALLANGHAVVATKRAHSDLHLVEDIAHEIEWIATDLSEAIFWDQYLNDIDAVVHAAAIVSFDKRWEKKMYKTNVKGTADLINAVLRSKVKDFVLVSSVAAIGRNSGQNEISENDRWEDSEFDSIYARAKYLQELEVWRGAEEGLKVKIINPSVVLGPGHWKDTGSTSVFKYAYEEKSFAPGGDINVVDVRDVAKATLLLLNAEIYNERFILSAGSMSYLRFFEYVAKAFDKTPPKRIPQGWMLRVGVWLEWLRSRLNKQEALITKETAKLSKSTFHYKNEKAKDTLKMEFRPIEESINWTAKELKKAYAL